MSTLLLFPSYALSSNAVCDTSKMRFTRLSPAEQDSVVRKIYETCRRLGQLNNPDCYKRTMDSALDEVAPQMTQARSRSIQDDIRSIERPPHALEHPRYEPVTANPNRPSVDPLNEMQLQQYETNWDPGTSRMVNDNPKYYGRNRTRAIDTSRSSVNGVDGRAIWVTDTNGQRYIINNPQKNSHFHSSVTEGRPIGAGGEIVAESGRIVRLNNRTWPYYPNSVESLRAEVQRITREVQQARRWMVEEMVRGPDGISRLKKVTKGWKVNAKVESVRDEPGGRVLEVVLDYVQVTY